MMLFLLAIAFLIAGTTSQIADDNSLTVHTWQGPVKGYKSTEGEFYGFYGIPYATEPKGKDKFRPPLPAPYWFDTFEAVNENIACIQSPIDSPDLDYADNCLVANIIVPKTNEKFLPVLVYVHGGRYQTFYGNGRQSKKLAVEGNIITVTFNYRLGANGFLCLGTAAAPGNAGMKDQIAALRWVQANIGAFGGNPFDVTLAGYSAGSAAVDTLLLSPATYGLFNKAIHESGYAGVGWGLQDNPIDNAVEYAATLGFVPKSIAELEEFYQNMSDKDLVHSGDIAKPDSSFPFVPCLEKEDFWGSAVLTKDPFEIIENQWYNRVPILSGITSQEGLVEYGLFSSFSSLLQNNVTSFLPQDIKVSDKNELERLENIFKETYFVNGTATALSYVRWKSDSGFKYPGLKMARTRAAAGFDVYFYHYTFYDETSQTVHEGVTGATHVAQTNAVTENPSGKIFYDEEGLSEDFKTVRREMRKLWISFIKNGRPVMEATEQYPVGWPPVTSAGYPYMSLGLNSELINTDLDPDTMQIWDEIYENYNVRPLPPRTSL